VGGVTMQTENGMRALLMTGMLLLCALPVDAATITYNKESGGIIRIAGEIFVNDDQVFSQVIKQYNIQSLAMVEFSNSPGGDLIAGINIGYQIHQKKWTTFARPGLCASVCGAMWLAGQEAYSDAYSLIGFHMASWGDDIAGTGNAFIGKYYSDIGLTFAQIAYLTKSMPKTMTWLTYEDAVKYNFERIKGVVPDAAHIQNLVLRYLPKYSTPPREPPSRYSQVPLCEGRSYTACMLCAMSGQMSAFSCRDWVESRHNCRFK
jgi:hypothetical protein